MPVDPSVLLNWPFPPVRHTYDAKDTILYALSVGLGADPLDAGQLSYVRESDTRTLAAMSTILAPTGPWTANPATGVTRSHLVQSEQAVKLHQPLPEAGTVESHARVIAVTDRGRDRGAVIHLQREIFDVGTGTLLATLDSASICRADGGFGGSSEPPTALHRLPEREADAIEELPTLSQQALLYRLNGDRNPLHADPDYARRAGFEQPILHGLCTFGMANHAVVRRYCGYSDAVTEISARFSSPVFPGDTLRVELWRDGNIVSFRIWSVRMSTKVLDNGRAVLA